LREGAFSSRDRGRLRTKIGAAIGQLSAGKLERGIDTHAVEIVGIFVAAGDGEGARADHVGERVRDPGRIAPIRKGAGELIGDPQTTFGLRQQHDAAIGREAAAIEICCDFLASHG
jgi:hypothetical protein